MNDQFTDPDFEVAPEDIREPEPEPWPPAAPEVPLRERVIQKQSYWDAVRKLRK